MNGNLACGPRSRAGSLGSVFEQVFGSPVFFGSPVTATPERVLPLDISEDATSFIVRANVPGFTKEQVNVEVHDGVLTIRTDRTEDKNDSTEQFHRRERRVEQASRSLRLPDDVKQGGVTAELKDGVLTLRLAKAEKAAPQKVRID